jgi:histidine triad (HIT) family protein
MQDSIFTKIIKGEIPSYKIYEDDQTFAFLDIHPSVPGHVLVIPKKQVEFLWDLDDETYMALMVAVKKIALHLRATLNVPFVGEKVVGVDVPHVHIHLIPFATTEEYRRVGDQTAEPDFEALKEIAEKLRMPQ